MSLFHKFMSLPAWQRIPLVVVLSSLVIISILATVDLTLSFDKIHPGVTVYGIEIGGLDRNAAADILEETARDRFARKLLIEHPEGEWEISGQDIGASLDVEQAVESAYRVGRVGDVLSRASDRVSSWVSGASIEASLSHDASAVAPVMTEIRKVAETPAVDAAVIIDGSSATLQTSSPGVALAEDRLLQAVLLSSITGAEPVEVPTETTYPVITDEQASSALEVTESMLASDVILAFENSRWTLKPELIGQVIAFRSQETTDPTSTPASVLVAYVDPAAASSTIGPVVSAAGRPAKNASFDVQSGSVRIIPGEEGTGPDFESLAKEMTRVLTDGQSRQVELRMTKIEPDITTQEAQAMGITDRFATYTTRFDRSNRPRVNNIHLIADSVDGVLLAPGETFSLNQRVGQRTAERGYQEAPAIINGRLVPSLGGGICQFGTTMFNTIFESGLPVIERRNHSFFISAYPPGRDATLAWGGPDLRFKNDTPNWILIDTAHTASSVTVNLYGTDPGFDVTSETSPWRDAKPYPVRETPDPTLPIGSRRVEQAGAKGGSVVVQRFVKRGGQVLRTDTFRSVYRPKEEIVRVGTKPPVSSPATSTTP